MPVAPSSPLPRDLTGLLRWAPRDAFPRAVAEDLRARADDHDHRVHLYDARTSNLELIKPSTMFVLAGTGPQAVWRGKYVEGTTTVAPRPRHGAQLPHYAGQGARVARAGGQGRTGRDVAPARRGRQLEGDDA